MGWLSDKLFGKKKRIDQNKINSYMQPYTKMIDRFEGIADDQMDYDSVMNRTARNRFMNQSYDMLGQNQNQLQQTAMMNNLSPAQMMAQQQQMANRTTGQFGTQMDQMYQNQYNQGLAGLMNVSQMRKGEGERLANAHIQSVNAHNQRRQGRMGLATGLLGMGLSFASGGMFGGGGGGGGGAPT